MTENKEEKPVKSEKQKMLDEELYYSGVPELKEALLNSKEMCYDYNNLRPREFDKKKEILKKLLKKVGEECYIEPPFFCDYGFNTTLGDNFYANHNLVILDVCEVTFGNNVFIGPNVGNNVWIGGSVCILPGVTIGDNVTIGAGSVVTKDIPSNVTAFGNPCKVYKVNQENVGKK